jgi:hypothetical protein
VPFIGGKLSVGTALAIAASSGDTAAKGLGGVDVMSIRAGVLLALGLQTMKVILSLLSFIPFIRREIHVAYFAVDISTSP